MDSESASESFVDRLRSACEVNRSWLLVGLDPDLSTLPAGITRDVHGVMEFNQRVVEATRDHVIGYKLNFAFYEALGSEGWQALERTRRLIPPSLIAVADAKRGDIGNAAEMYARAIFDNMEFDAATITPYVGLEGLRPFLERRGKGSFIVCRTSNRDSSVQELSTAGGPVFQRVAEMAGTWGDNAGLVMGATDLEALAAIRQLLPDVPFLVPGIGAQGGNLERAVQAAMDASGGNALMSSSRSVIYASSNSDFEEAARREAIMLRSRIANATAQT